MRGYSERAIKALTFLFRPYNDIDVYVEDTVCRNMYEVLINRILDGRARVTRVFQLGGRSAVVEECRKQQGTFVRRSLFLIDGDYDIVQGLAPLSLPRLYRLNVYCSENLLICSCAAEEIAYECRANIEKSAAALHLDFDRWMSELERPLQNLFLVYAVVHKLSPAIETSGYHVYQLTYQIEGQPHIDLTKASARRRKLQAQIKGLHPISAIRREYRTILTNIIANKYGALHVVSGKTYLLPLLHSYLRRRVKYKGDMNTLRIQLARYCRTDIDPGFREAVLRASRL